MAQLGHNDIMTAYFPRKVIAIKKEKVVNTVCGEMHTYFLTGSNSFLLPVFTDLCYRQG